MFRRRNARENPSIVSFIFCNEYLRVGKKKLRRSSVISFDTWISFYSYGQR